MFTGELRAFQEEAVNRIFDRGRQLVAYEMGLGKTVVTVCAVEELHETGKVESGLVVVPASLKYQWGAKITEFTGDDNYVIIDGTPTERAKQYEKARRLKPRYIILNYEKVRDEWSEVVSLPRDYICTDEATVYKTPRAKISKRIKRLQSNYNIGLTGQPIENRPEDLFSIMQMVDERVLGRWDIFDKTFIVRDNFGRVTRVKNLPLMWDLMDDAMSRKTRHDPDVAPYMPQVTETVTPVLFDVAGAKVYRRIVSDLLSDLETVQGNSGFDLFAHYSGSGDDGDNTMRGQIMAKMTVLRMLCDHPTLVRLSAAHYNDPDTKAGSEYASDLDSMGLLEPLKQTPKMRTLIDTLEEVMAENDRNKVVVFSTFVPTLQIIADAMPKIGSVLFHGGMDAKTKDAAKRKFAGDRWTRLFLSSDAGGYGVDLPNANYLINYDLPWSAGKWDQRNARIIRLSSEFDKVHLNNLVMKGSLEERQYDMLQAKKAIASAMVDKRGADVKGRLDLGLDTLTKFLQDTRV